MDNDIDKSWERFLNPEVLRTNLIVASLYITAFEMLKESIIDRIKNFFIDGFDESGWIINDKYRSEVLGLNRSPVYASLQWLKNRDVINEDDIANFNDIKNCRNEIVHEITTYISNGSKIDPLPLFSKITDLLLKIEKWWIINVEIPVNPDFDDKDIDEEGIVPGGIITLRLLSDIALGTEKESKFYYNELMKQNKDT